MRAILLAKPTARHLLALACDETGQPGTEDRSSCAVSTSCEPRLHLVGSHLQGERPSSPDRYQWIGRVGRRDFTAGLSQVGSRTGAVPRRSGLSVAPRFLWECLISQTVDPFPAPASSNAACGFPALRFPVCFVPRLM